MHVFEVCNIKCYDKIGPLLCISGEQLFPRNFGKMQVARGVTGNLHTRSDWFSSFRKRNVRGGAQINNRVTKFFSESPFDPFYLNNHHSFSTIMSWSLQHYFFFSKTRIRLHTKLYVEHDFGTTLQIIFRIKQLFLGIKCIFMSKFHAKTCCRT